MSFAADAPTIIVNLLRRGFFMRKCVRCGKKTNERSQRLWTKRCTVGLTEFDKVLFSDGKIPIHHSCQIIAEKENRRMLIERTAKVVREKMPRFAKVYS